MATIDSLRIRKILDSRGSATVEVEVRVKGVVGRAAAPGGASTGVHEVQALPEGGVDRAIEIFNVEVASKLIGRDVGNQKELDLLLHEIDGTDKFSKIGGNVATATSLALAKAAAGVEGKALYRYLGGEGELRIPYPLGNVIGGGKHAVGGTDIQEFLCLALSPSPSASIFANAKVHKLVKESLVKMFPDLPLGKGDEGAWVAKMGNEAALRVLAEATSKVSREVGFECMPAMDLAASEFFENGKYVYREGVLDTDQQVEFLVDLVNEFNVAVLEDPFHEEDYEGYARLTKLIGKRCLIVGDDLFVTNVARLRKGIEKGAANAILIKPNQIGTLSDTQAAVDLARRHGYTTIVSHRSGETTDESIAHLAVAFGSYAIKTGTVGGERVAKLNELVRIEEQFTGE